MRQQLAAQLNGARPGPARQSSHAARGPSHAQRLGKTPLLQADEALDAIDVGSLPRLRDRALIGLMVYTF